MAIFCLKTHFSGIPGQECDESRVSLIGHFKTREAALAAMRDGYIQESENWGDMPYDIGNSIEAYVYIKYALEMESPAPKSKRKKASKKTAEILDMEAVNEFVAKNKEYMKLLEVDEITCISDIIELHYEAFCSSPSSKYFFPDLDSEMFMDILEGLHEAKFPNGLEKPLEDYWYEEIGCVIAEKFEGLVTYYIEEIELQ
jgi:hypothetical protein